MNAKRFYSVALILIALVLGGCATSPEKPAMSDSEKQNRIQSLITTAKEDQAAGNFAVALLHYEQVLDLDANNVSSLIGAGDSAYRLKKYSDAEKWRRCAHCS